MRLKSINIDERSSTFSDDRQQKSLKEMSNSINQVGQVFDNMVQLESFVLQGIHEELSALIGIRENKDQIVEEFGMKSYLEDYFSPSVYKVEGKISEVIDQWNSANDRLSTEELKGTIVVLKEVAQVLNNLGAEKYKSTAILNDLIDEFGYFQVAKVIFTGDIVDRVNVLTKLKSEIEEIFAHHRGQGNLSSLLRLEQNSSLAPSNHQLGGNQDLFEY